MSGIDINHLNENDTVKFITTNKTLIDGRIKKITPDFLGIKISNRQNDFMTLHKNDTIELILIYKHKALKCSSIILGCTQNDHGQTLILSIPKLILSIDRREFERLSILMDIEYSMLPSESNYKFLTDVEQKYFRSLKKSYTVNISAGGVYFIVSKDEVDSDLALLSFSVRNEKITSLCKKVRTDLADDSKHLKVAYKYNDMKNDHRQLILDFVTEKLKDINNNK